MIHHHIRWAEAKLDWEAFQTQEQARAVAEELKRPGEKYDIEKLARRLPTLQSDQDRILAYASQENTGGDLNPYLFDIPIHTQFDHGSESLGMQNRERTETSIDLFANQLRKPEAVLFWQYLDENPTAKDALTGLHQAGCDPLTLMTLAVLYCKGEELGVAEIAKQATGYSPQHLASFSERLLQAAKDIQRLNESAMAGGITLWKLIRVLGGGERLEKTLASVLPSEQLDFEFTRLPVILAAFAVFLKGWPHPTYRSLMSEHDLGRKFFLAEFIVYVETIVGHANWNAVASVIAAVHFSLSKPEGVSVDAETLRSAVDEFQKRNPSVYVDVKRWAASTVGSRHRKVAETGSTAASG